ncbi:MAG: hypothetical protein DHS20C15_30800 [Planctomycetota bacterium]|nr:MAG: hypothetical protein DHS20C15_30800 [Planctomycetota bacterium]
MNSRFSFKRTLTGLVAVAALGAVPVAAQEVNSQSLSENGWFSDDTRADGFGSEAAGTNLISDTLTDDPEGSASGVSTHDADINSLISFVPAPGSAPAGTHLGAVHLNIGNNAGGKAQISHRIDDGTGHFPGSALSSGFNAEYSWMGDGMSTITASLKFGVKTADFGSTGSSSRTGENAWDKVLIYEPGQGNGKVSDGTWQTETIDFSTGKWWFFDRTIGASNQSSPLSLADMATSTATYKAGDPKTVQDVYNLITAAGAHITSVQFGIGSGNANGSVYVNQLECSAYRTGMITTFGCGEPFYANGFETDDFGWNVFSGPAYASTRVASGTNGISSASGSFHSETTATAAGNWGGYSGVCGCASTACAASNDVFPAGGYRTSIDIWLDVDGGFANNSFIEFSSAMNNTAGSHNRDFIFNGVFLDSSDFTGPNPGENRFVWAASHNSVGDPVNGVDPIAITSSGWYTFENVFYDSGAGILGADYVISDSAGNELVRWTRINPSDVINSTVGGNRYGWFVTNDLGLIAFDNACRKPGAFDQNVTPDTIFGTGNANGAFTVDRQDGVELGLRGKLRFPTAGIYNSNGDGTYTFSTGSGTSTPPNAEWAWDWSVNTDYDDSTGLVVQDLDYEMGIDFDPGAGTDYLVFDPIAPGSVIPYTTPQTKDFWDHSMGDNTTGMSMGVEATDVPTYLALIAANNVAQNSWRSTFYNQPPFDGFDPDVPGRYEVYLSASDGASEVARTQISILAMDGVTLSLEADLNQADQNASLAGVQVATELWLRNPDDTEVTGWQAFLSFPSGMMTYESALSSYTAAPFGAHLTSTALANVAAGELRLDGNTLPSPMGTTGDAKLATLFFTVSECTPVGVAFDLGQPFPSETSFLGSPIATDLIDGPSIVPDNTAPVLVGTPANITQPADAGSCASAVVTWTDPTATDNCDPSPTVVCSPASGSTFGVGTTTVTCTATDLHGNESTSTFDVTVTATNAVDVTVVLAGSDPTTRCIEFVADCGASTSVSMNFVGSPATATATIELPCGSYTTLCAKDEQHTMWDTTTLTNSGVTYTADTTLVLNGGDTDDDGDVDINDVTLLLAQFGTVPAIGPCPWDGVTRNADFSNNGPVGSEDYVFITANWLQVSACVCPSPASTRGGSGPQTRLSVVDSLTRAADLNRDGFIDVLDVEVLEQRHALSGELSRRMRR